MTFSDITMNRVHYVSYCTILTTVCDNSIKSECAYYYDYYIAHMNDVQCFEVERSSTFTLNDILSRNLTMEWKTENAHSIVALLYFICIGDMALEFYD